MDSIKTFLTSEEFYSQLSQWGLNLVIALAIFILGRWLAKAVTGWLRRRLTKRDLDPMLANFLANILYALLLTAVVIAAIGRLGVQTTSLVAILGAAGLAVGLALKDSLSNFASGVMLILFRPFHKGDQVEIGGVEGKVDEIRIFSTIINTLDNKQVTVPNANITADSITNYTALGTRRVDMVVGIGYDDDLKQAQGILQAICDEHPLVLKDPAPAVALAELGDSSVNFNVRPWCNSGDYWTVWSDVLGEAKIRLEAAGLSIPYPQQDVHMHTVEAANG